MASFGGFHSEDFEVFSVPDFAERMAEIRARIRPRLVELGEDLAAGVEAEVGLPTFPHAAQHMRRRVNPPAETWVAFGRDRKGYKRWTHFRFAIRASGVRVTVFVEDDADDKPAFAACLAAQAEPLLAAVGGPEGLHCDGLAEGAVLSAASLADLGVRLARLKGLKFQAGVALPAAAAAALAPAALEAWALGQIQRLKPLYVAGAAGEFRS